MWLTSGQVAERHGVTRATVGNWIKNGKFDKFERTEGGHYRVWVQSDPTTILYGRISSSKQSSSLERQVELLRERYPEAEVITDIASGFNFKRQGFTSVLERALRGDSIKLVATTSDRISRSGFPLIAKVIQLHGGTIELLEEDVYTESFDVATLVSFLTSFCNSQSGKRSRNRNKKNKDLSRKRKSI